MFLIIGSPTISVPSCYTILKWISHQLHLIHNVFPERYYSGPEFLRFIDRFITIYFVNQQATDAARSLTQKILRSYSWEHVAINAYCLAKRNKISAALIFTRCYSAWQDVALNSNGRRPPMPRTKWPTVIWGGPKWPSQPFETSDVTWAQTSNPVSNGQWKS